MGLCDVSNCFFSKFQAFRVWLRDHRLIYKKPSNETFTAIYALAKGTTKIQSQPLLHRIGLMAGTSFKDGAAEPLTSFYNLTSEFPFAVCLLPASVYSKRT